MSTVLVTGANRGIGLALVRQLYARSAEKYPLIIGTCRELRDGELADLTNSSEGRIRRLACQNISDPESVQSAVNQISKMAPNGVNILINNAGRANNPTFRLPTVQGALEFQKQLNTNAFGALLVTSTLISNGLLSSSSGYKPPIDRHSYASSRTERPDLSKPSSSSTRLNSDCVRSRSEPPEPNVPVVANIWSTQGSMTHAGEIWKGGSTRDDLIFHPIYAASKVALSGVSMHLARELREDAIVNCIHPGWVKTEHGRAYANLSTDESAAKVLDVIESWKTVKDSGQWVNEEGEAVPL